MSNRSVGDGIRLGIFQANALGAPVGATVLFAYDHPVPALILIISAALGWAGWWRDFRFSWRP